MHMRILSNAEIGQRLKDARVAANKTQSCFAQELDLAQPTICSWEQGTVAPPSRLWNQIASLLSASPAELFFGSGKKVG